MGPWPAPWGLPGRKPAWILLWLPGLKVNVRQEDCRWESAASPGELGWLLGRGWDRSKERSLEPPDAPPPQFCVGRDFFVGLGGVNLVKNWEPQYLGLKQFSPVIYILYLKTSI